MRMFFGVVKKGRVFVSNLDANWLFGGWGVPEGQGAGSQAKGEAYHMAFELIHKGPPE